MLGRLGWLTFLYPPLGNRVFLHVRLRSSGIGIDDLLPDCLWGLEKTVGGNGTASPVTEGPI
jgi:hypothetical protein